MYEWTDTSVLMALWIAVGLFLLWRVMTPLSSRYSRKAPEAIKAAEIDRLLQSEGGAGKRLDEHRELVELLRKKAPDLLQQHPWVNGWLESQDSYLDRLYRLALRRKAIPEHWSRTVRNRISGDSHV